MRHTGWAHRLQVTDVREQREQKAGKPGRLQLRLDDPPHELRGRRRLEEELPVCHVPLYFYRVDAVILRGGSDATGAGRNGGGGGGGAGREPGVVRGLLVGRR